VSILEKTMTSADYTRPTTGEFQWTPHPNPLVFVPQQIPSDPSIIFEEAFLSYTHYPSVVPDIEENESQVRLNGFNKQKLTSE